MSSTKKHLNWDGSQTAQYAILFAFALTCDRRLCLKLLILNPDSNIFT